MPLCQKRPTGSSLVGGSVATKLKKCLSPLAADRAALGIQGSWFGLLSVRKMFTYWSKSGRASLQWLGRRVHDM